MKNPWIALLAGVLLGSQASAESLTQVFQRALSADPTMRQAEALHLATRETKTQAILALLPLDASASKNWGRIGSVSTTSDAIGTLGVNVNLFSWNKWIALKQANSTVAQGEADYEAARQGLIQRVAQRYFAVLNAREQLAAQQSALESLSRQLEQANKRYEVGLIAITDVQSARASRDSTAAAVIAAQRALLSAQDQLRAITGEKYLALDAPREDMPLLSPDPADEESWVQTAMSQNASLTSSRMSAEIAHDGYLSAIGGHIPSVSATASRSWDLQHTSSTSTAKGQVQAPNGVSNGLVNTADIVWSLSVTVPIFSAGATQSLVRQARYTSDAARAGLEAASRATEEGARDAYQGVISQIAQVQALKQAVESNRVALAATEAGYEVGTKTVLDVLTARQQLVAAQSSYADARYGYLNNLVALRLAAGNLDRQTIDLINGWLQPASAPGPGTPLNPAAAPPPPAPAAPPAAPGAG